MSAAADSHKYGPHTLAWFMDVCVSMSQLMVLAPCWMKWQTLMVLTHVTRHGNCSDKPHQARTQAQESRCILLAGHLA